MYVKKMLVLALTMLLGVALVLAQGDSKSEAEAITQMLQDYAAAVESKDLAEIEKYVVTTDAFTVFEGGHINWGWADYRDHHLAPELKEFQEFKYSYENIKPHVVGDLAYATLKYNIYIKMKEREIDGQGLATMVLTKQDGAWKIRHVHTSRIPKRKH